MPNQIDYLSYHNEEIAFQRQAGEARLAEAGHIDEPGLVFLGGFRSDMTGSKAESVADYATQSALDYLRFDYFGHGQSSGDFLKGTVSHWRAETAYVLDTLTKGRQILIGSSFGGWLAMMMAVDMPTRIAAVVLIAPAIDMTTRLMWDKFSPHQQAQLLETGLIHTPSDYDEAGYPITKNLIEDGRAHLMLDAPILYDGAVRILHGQKDDAVPYQLSLELAEKLSSHDVEIHFVKQGDHSLSEPHNLKLLHTTIDALRTEIRESD